MTRALALHGGRPAVNADEHVRWPVIGTEARQAVLAVLDRGVLSGQFAPEVVFAIATSDASRPRAMRTRPIRGMLLRGSKVYQPSPM